MCLHSNVIVQFRRRKELWGVILDKFVEMIVFRQFLAGEKIVQPVFKSQKLNKVLHLEVNSFFK